jgi:hypothetical protein
MTRSRREALIWMTAPRSVANGYSLARAFVAIRSRGGGPVARGRAYSLHLPLPSNLVRRVTERVPKTSSLPKIPISSGYRNR